MASKLNTSLPRRRRVSPPEPLSAQRDEVRRTRITNERQQTNPSPLGRFAPGFICECDPPMPIPGRLFAPGRGKPAGSTRKLRRMRLPQEND